MRFKLRCRLLYLAIGIAAFVVAYSVGAAVTINTQQAKDIRDQFYDQIRNVDQNGIFINNIRIALAMFIPGIGAGLGAFSAFSTGLVFSAIAEISGFKNIPPLLILITPFGIMELFAYGIAISRSGMLVYQIAKRKPWREYAIPTLIEIGIVIVLLLSGAIVEWEMIQQFGGLEKISAI